MKDKLGVLLMEEEDGNISVQLFSDPDKAGESFDNLNGRQGQKPQRATFIKLDYANATTTGVSKDLPVPPTPIDERPDGYRIGEGPVKFDKEQS